MASVQQVDIVEHDKSLSDLVSSELPEHLQSLFDRSCERLSEKEKSQFLDLLRQYQDIFVGPDGNLGERIL